MTVESKNSLEATSSTSTLPNLKESCHDDNQKRQFIATLDSINTSVLNYLKSIHIPPDCLDRLRVMINHNVLGGKLNRGLAVVDTLHICQQHEANRPGLTEMLEYKANLLGWCVELLQASFLVADDIMDASITRRGKPCWYKKEDVGLNAINDSFLLRSFIFRILKNYFHNEPYYPQLLQLFIDVGYDTELGQMVDLETAPDGRINTDQFVKSRYEWIVLHKTAYYTCYLPVALGLHLAGKGTPENLKQAQDILLDLGIVFQIQDDYLDVFGSPETIGKIGTDIEDNKCAWPIVKALEIASDSQKKLLQAMYGKHDKDCIAKVKEIFNELKIEELYREYEEQEFAKIRAKVDNISGNVPKEVYLSVMGKIFKRQS